MFTLLNVGIGLNSLAPGDTYIRPLSRSKPKLTICHLEHGKQSTVEMISNPIVFIEEFEFENYMFIFWF